MSTENLFSMTEEELERAYDNAQVEALRAKEAAKIFQQELWARHQDLRVGQMFEIVGKNYAIVSFEMFWPVFIEIKKDGSRAIRSKHAYHWTKYKSGASNDPW